MNYFRFLVFIAFALLVTVTLLNAKTSRGQSPAATKTSRDGVLRSTVKPTAAVRERRAKPTAESDFGPSLFGPAAARNALLSNELNWTFGGKQQRGWYLYTPLISRLLDTADNTPPADFASALTHWQEKSGLGPSGVLDEATLYAMVSEWQSARLKERAYPAPDQLVTAPAADFYDPSRPDELRQVERETYTAYKRMIAAAAADQSLGLALSVDGRLAPAENYLKILSSFRTREYQERLRQQSTNSGRAGLAVNSPHFTGRALDLYVGGDPVETKDSNRALQIQTPVYLWLVRNAERFGFHPYFYEPWHWEYVN